jgi:hypothetical protein
MAKLPSSIIGVDIGRYAFKSVLLQRRGPERLAVTHIGSYVPAETPTDTESLGRCLKALMKDMGYGSREQESNLPAKLAGKKYYPPAKSGS